MTFAPRGPRCSSASMQCIDPPIDDRTNRFALGYVVKLVSGDAPPGLSFPYGPVLEDTVQFGEDVFELAVAVPWQGDDDERLDINVTLSAVDLGNNEGPPSAPVRVEDGGLGCSAGAATPQNTCWQVTGSFGLIWLWRRRLRRGGSS